MKGFPRSQHAHLLGRIKRPLLPSPSCTDGFALIIALGLMSITLLTVLSLASLVRIQTGSEVHSIQEAQAKANARLALMLALGQLHKNAGPDQRVTARGEILQDLSGDGTRHWTGVWDTRSMEDGPTWLITEIQGAQPDQQKTLTHPTETGLNVDVPLRTVGGTTSDPTGTYAWWTSDENTKANVAARSYLNAGNPNMVRKQIATAASFDRDINELAERRMVIPNDPSFLEKMTRTLHSEQIPYLLGNGDPGQVLESQNLLKQRFHDYTLHSTSALTNTWDGGLRLDLSHLRRLGPTASQADIDAAFEHPNFPNWPFLTPGLAEYLDFAPGNIGNIVTPQASESYYEDPLGFKIAPLITEFFFIGDFIVRSFVGGVSDEVILYYYIASELFNPYTQRMN